MKRIIALGMLLTTGGLVSAIAAQQQPARPPLPDLMKVKDNLYVIASSTPGPEFTGGNTGVLRHRHRRHPRRHEAGRLRTDDHRADQEGHRQAGDDDHQHPHARRSHGQQRRLPGDRRHRRAREHQGEHGEDGRVQGREGAVPAEADVQGQAVGRERQRPHGALLLRRRATPTATRGSCIRRCGCCRPATCSRGATRRRSIATTAAAASSIRRRWQRRSRRSRTSTPSSPAIAR